MDLKVLKDEICLKWFGKLFQSFAAVNLKEFIPYLVVLGLNNLAVLEYLKL